MENLPKAEFKMLQSMYDHSSWKASTSSSSDSRPIKMSEKEWAIVFHNNNILCGQYIAKERRIQDGIEVRVPVIKRANIVVCSLGLMKYHQG